MVDDLVDRLKVFHSSPVAGEEAGMTGSSDGAIMLFDLLEWDTQKVEAESRPGVDGQAGGNSSLVLGQAGAEEAHRTSHRTCLAGPRCPTPIGRWGASRWLHLKWSSAYTHDALLSIGLDEPSCPISCVGMLCDNASR